MPHSCLVLPHNRLTRSHLARLIYGRGGIEWRRPFAAEPEASPDPNNPAVWKDKVVHPTRRRVGLDQGATEDAPFPIPDRVSEPRDDVVVGRVVEVLLDPDGSPAETIEIPHAFGVDGTWVPVVEVVDGAKRSPKVQRSLVVAGPSR